jgi:hypothetical protein
MSIAEVSQVAALAPTATRAVGDAPAQSGASETALVPVSPGPQRFRPAGQSPLRSEAPFLAHLIATAELVPQTRTLRRGTPAEAVAAYRSTAQNVAVATGARLSQDA